MATQAFTEFEDLTTCTICLETFTRPKVLPCQHSYCYACLWLIGKDKSTITCPYCQEEHKIPDSGVIGFKDNLLLNNLVGMTLPKTEICADCRQHPSADHACEHCQQELCSRCLVEHSKLFTEFSITLSQLRDNLTASSRDKKLVLGTHRNNLECERRKMNETFRSEAVNKLIEVKIIFERANFMDIAMANITELYEVLASEEREAAIESYITKLLGKSSECVTADTLSDLRKNLTDLKTVLRLIETQDEEFRFKYTPETGFQQVEFGQAVVNVRGKYQTENILNQITDLVHDSAEVLRNHVTTTCQPRVDHVVPLLPPSMTAEVQTQTENRFQEPDSEKKNTDGSLSVVKVNSSPQQTERVALNPESSEVRKCVQNQLPRHVDYAGKSQGDVVVIGQGESVEEENRLHYPRGCAYHVERDEIFVADRGNDRIMAYSADGRNARVFYTDVRYPSDVAVSSDGDYLFIAYTRSLIKVNMDGHTVRTVNEFSLGDFQCCWSVTCYQEFTVVVDGGHKCVIVYNDREEELRCFGQGRLKNPRSVAMSDEQKFYVTDGVNSRVHVFDWSGAHMLIFGETGSGGDTTGIAVDGYGNVCVSRPGSRRIDVYSPGRRLVTSISSGGKDGQLKCPWGLLLTPDGRLIVVDHQNHRVQIF